MPPHTCARLHPCGDLGGTPGRRGSAQGVSRVRPLLAAGSGPLLRWPAAWPVPGPSVSESHAELVCSPDQL